MLPYRVDPEDLYALVEGRARGRSLEQLSSLFSRKTYDGLMRAAEVLGFLDPDSGELSDRGHDLALADPERRQDLLKECLLDFEPYDLLIEAALKRDEARTTLDWIETWWGSQGFGSSESNRSEASSTFGRLVEAAGLGVYVQGRRGHPSRIEWAEDAKGRIRETQEQSSTYEREHLKRTPGRTRDVPERPGELIPRVVPTSEMIDLNLPLGDGRVVWLRAPTKVTKAEKDRIENLLDHLLVVDPQAGEEPEEEAEQAQTPTR